MTSYIRTLAATVLASVLLVATAACSTFSAAGRDRYNEVDHSTAKPTPGISTTPAKAKAPVLPYDIQPLLYPKKKFFGVAADGAPASLKPVDQFAAKAGKNPNLIEFYSAFGDQYEAQLVQKTWNAGALAYIAWEPMKTSLSSIAAGKYDAYIRQYADSVKQLNLPVAISFAHEMNGFWYPWGTKHATAKQFVSAWKHVHDIFAQEGATQVIWVWSPNAINPMPSVRLAPYWPGDAYVDWVGVIGYYGLYGPATYKTLYQPTMTQIRAFTRKPFIIAETASEGGARKPADIADLFLGTAKHPDVIGFVWFNFLKETDWRITSSPEAAAAFRRQAQNPRFGFDVKRP
jgi:hypothetical protein